MKVRYKGFTIYGTADKFDSGSIGVVIVHTDIPGWLPETPVTMLDVYLENSGEWRDMRTAFSNHELVTDSRHLHFAERPASTEVPE